MRRERILTWLPFTGIAACSLLMTFASMQGDCFHMLWRCTERNLLLTLLTLVVVSPVLIGVGNGLLGGIMQITRTSRALQHLRTLPRGIVPAPVEAVARGLQLLNRLDVVDSAEATAFCYGLLRPRILVTTGLISKLTLSEVKAVLRHERHHLQRRDPLRAVLWTILDHMCWWMEQGSEHAQLARELAADRAVIAAGGRQPLASALLKLLTHTRSQEYHRLAVSGISVTEARIEQLLHPERAVDLITSSKEGYVIPVMTAVILLLCAVAMAG
jgi:Zn-dependent protease with chaperone function